MSRSVFSETTNLAPLSRMCRRGERAGAHDFRIANCLRRIRWLRLNVEPAIVRRAPDCPFVDINGFLGLFDRPKAVAFAQRPGPSGLGHTGRGAGGPPVRSRRQHEVLTGEFGNPILGSLLGGTNGGGTTTAGGKRP